MNRSLTLSAAAILSVLAATRGWSQTSCDPGVRGDVDHPQAYRQRGDRCEGLYWRPHAGERGVSIVGLRRVVPAKLPPTPASLRLGWRKRAPIHAAGNVLIRAVSLRPELFYRMDTSKAYSVGAYDWPTDVLSALHLELKDVGVLAFISTKIGEVMWQVHFPLDVAAAEGTSSTYEVIVVPGTALADLSWQCTRIGADGVPGAKLAGETLRRQSPAGVPIRLQITLPRYEGFVYLELDATALSPNISDPVHADLAFFASQ